MFNRILIVCTGNICRSIMAEALLRKRLLQTGHNAEVRSAGIGAMVDYPADEIAQTLMRAKDLDISSHRAKQLSLELSRWADLILVMETHHRDAVLKMDPTARGKTFLLRHWNGHQSVPDPYLREAVVYEHALKLIESSLEVWAEKL